MKKYKLLNCKAHEIPNGNVALYNSSVTFIIDDEVYILEEDIIEIKNLDYVPSILELREIKDRYFNKFRKEMPKVGDIYYTIDSSGIVFVTEWDGGFIDLYRFNYNVIFDTEENAKYYRDQEQRFNKLIKEMEIEFAKGGEIDWGDDKQFKYYMFYSCKYEKLEYSCISTVKQHHSIYCADIDIVKQFIIDHEEELTEYFKWEIEKSGGKI